MGKCKLNFKVGFRGRCIFKMYFPNKPNKFGITIFMICDNATNYVVKAETYLGKSTNTEDKPLVTYFLEKFANLYTEVIKILQWVIGSPVFH